MSTHDEIVKEVLDSITEDEVHERVAETIPEFLEDDWEEEFDDETEAYAEQGRGEAEDVVLQNIVKPITDKYNLDLDAYCDVYDEVKNEWCL